MTKTTFLVIWVAVFLTVCSVKAQEPEFNDEDEREIFDTESEQREFLRPEEKRYYRGGPFPCITGCNIITVCNMVRCPCKTCNRRRRITTTTTAGPSAEQTIETTPGPETEETQTQPSNPPSDPTKEESATELPPAEDNTPAPPAQENTPAPPAPSQNTGSFCANRSDGDYVNWASCSTFYKCSGGRTFVEKCPKGTAYSATLKVCDWIRNVPRCNKMPRGTQ